MRPMPALLPALALLGLPGRAAPADSGARPASTVTAPTPPPAAEGQTFNGRRGELDVRPPRLEGADAEVRVDGVLADDYVTVLLSTFDETRAGRWRSRSTR